MAGAGKFQFVRLASLPVLTSLPLLPSSIPLLLMNYPCSALLFYDWLIQFPTEVYCIWQQKGIIIKLIYFPARYLNLLGSLVYVAVFTAAGSEEVSPKLLLAESTAYVLIFTVRLFFCTVVSHYLFTVHD